jgi:hypothetical protein
MWVEVLAFDVPFAHSQLESASKGEKPADLPKQGKRATVSAATISECANGSKQLLSPVPIWIALSSAVILYNSQYRGGLHDHELNFQSTSIPPWNSHMYVPRLPPVRRTDTQPIFM